MKGIKSISIPQPCHEQWENMTANANGRYCSSCSKTVVDFSNMTTQQVLDYLSSTSHVCGRISSTQLAGINHRAYHENLSKTGLWKRLMMAVIMLGSSQYLSAQSRPDKPVTEQHDTPLLLGKVVAAQPDSTSKLVTGQVIDERNEPLPGASIRIKGTNVSTTTNKEGLFSLHATLNTALTVSFVGYSTQEINVTAANMGNIVCKEVPAMMGEVVVVAGGISVKHRSFIGRIYYRFIKRPVKKIFG